MSIKDYHVPRQRAFRVINQDLLITSIDFKEKRIIGFTQLQVISLVDELPVIRLNSQQVCIKSIYIDNYKCDFKYSDPLQEICASSGSRTLDTFSNAHAEVIKSTDSDLSNGELCIEVPSLSDIRKSVLERSILTISISFMLENPVSGLCFIVNEPSEDNNIESEFMPHLYTCRRSNSNRLWFPCVDSFSESCTWSISVTVDEAYTAICSGELSQVEHCAKEKKKRYYYNLAVPTSACNIGLVVGPFVPMVHPDMHEVVHFTLPTLKTLLLDTCAYTHKIFEYYEELLSSRYPYPTYKQVFVDQLDCKYQSYATLSIFSINLLHSKKIIEQTFITRKALARAIAEQFFGCFISMQSVNDAWLTSGIAEFLALDYFRKAFGNNQYRFLVKKAMEKVIKYEQQFRPIILDPTKTKNDDGYFYIRNSHTLSPIYSKMRYRKSFLIVRMLENYLGRELLLQVFIKMLSLAQNAAPQPHTMGTWVHLHISTSYFIWAISTVTGTNIETFLKQWVYQGGHVKFTGSFIFNRKRNTVELEIKQKHINDTGVRRYLGPVVIWLQELDGTFKHNLQIEDNLSKHDITCHSKSRRNKRKRIPLCTSEEIDMDLSFMDPESPVLWLRIDPERILLREVVLEQPDFQWIYQLLYERDVVAQLESLSILDRYFSHPNTKKALNDIVNNNQVFYRVRCEAATCLSRVANKLGANWIGPPALLTTFRKMFGSPSCPQIVRMNNFAKFQMYFLQKAIIVAMAALRTVHGICPHEVLQFLLDLLKYNDNTNNAFSDDYYRATLIDALAGTVTAVAIIPTFENINTADIIPTDTRHILEEITRCFNLDKLLPSYKHVVTISCLRAIRHLQKMGHIPNTPFIFRCHTSPNCFVDVRKASIEILVNIVKSEARKEDFDFLLNLVVEDSSSSIKYHILQQFIHHPPFDSQTEEHVETLNKLDTEELVETLWNMMNKQFPFHSKLRCAVVDFYYVLYNIHRPRCLPPVEFNFVLNLDSDKKNIDSKKDSVSTKKSTVSVALTSNYLRGDVDSIGGDNFKNYGSPSVKQEDSRDAQSKLFSGFAAESDAAAPGDVSFANYSMPQEVVPTPASIPTISIRMKQPETEAPVFQFKHSVEHSTDAPVIKIKEKKDKDEGGEGSSKRKHKDKKKKKKNKHKKHHSTSSKHHSSGEE